MDLQSALSVETDPDACLRWLDSWFGEDSDERVALTLLRDGKRASIAVNTTWTLSEWRKIVREEGGLDAATWHDDHAWGIYVGVGTLGKVPDRRNSRGTREDVARIPGLWMDFDAKDGGFDGEEEVLRLLRGLPPEGWPTAIVATGTGGIHGYWRLTPGLAPEGVARLCDRWWAYLSERAGRHIDRLTAVDRLMKLPGGVRWPKYGEDDVSPAAVRLLYADETDRVVDPAWVEDVTREAVAHDEERKRAVQAERAERARDASAVASRAAASSTTGANLYAIAGLETQANELLSWSEILTPKGWTEIGEDADGRTLWSRPGGEGRKSATTDFGTSHVMTLFSDSPDTGLSELLETGAVLSKYAVYVELWHGGHPARFIESWLENGWTFSE